eukprot:TRINITY_DN12504_c0_g1_i1.p2 TRINITY_DN12504_c0_g1~~TRINITY_DN12504_c0_g1_i1.p2  ORF type:complete len:104 (-),score=15.22 TRINITY_DN12504_c0_g1_i1:173-484(-)
MNRNEFEETIDSDSLENIFSFFKGPFKIPLFFVNKRWREVGQRKRKSNPYSNGLNYQKLVADSKSRFYRLPFAVEAAKGKQFELMKWSVNRGCAWGGDQMRRK